MATASPPSISPAPTGSLALFMMSEHRWTQWCDGRRQDALHWESLPPEGAPRQLHSCSHCWHVVVFTWWTANLRPPPLSCCSVISTSVSLSCVSKEWLCCGLYQPSKTNANVSTRNAPTGHGVLRLSQQNLLRCHLGSAELHGAQNLRRCRSTAAAEGLQLARQRVHQLPVNRWDQPSATRTWHVSNL